MEHEPVAPIRSGLALARRADLLIRRVQAGWDWSDKAAPFTRR